MLSPSSNIAILPLIAPTLEIGLQAKVTKVLGMLGKNKGEVIYAVWGVQPGKGDRYNQALAEYDQVIRIIGDMARKELDA